jgi:uncharacterized repeat protein (TIGR01451 family)
MFRRLLSNLPFNPSLIDQVSFYAKRLHDEAVLRRIGFFFVLLAMFVQMFAIIAPPTDSFAASYTNDIISGGPKLKSQIISNMKDASKDVSSIYAYFGVGLDEVNKLCNGLPDCAPTTTIQTYAKNNYWSIGRHDVREYRNNQYANQDFELHIAGAQTPIHARPLHAWDTYAYSSYKAWHGTNKEGREFWIMADCGNIVTVDTYTPPAPPTPRIAINKVRTTEPTAKAGENVTYRLQYKNTVENSVAHNFSLSDAIDNQFDFVSVNGSGVVYDASTRSLLWNGPKNLGYGTDYSAIDVTLKVKDSLKSGTKICNIFSVHSDESSDATMQPTDARCVQVFNPCPLPGKSTIPVDDGSNRCVKDCNNGSSVGDPSCIQECKPGIPVGDARCTDCPLGQVRDQSGTCKTPEPAATCTLTSEIKGNTATFKARVTVSDTTVKVSSYRYDFDAVVGTEKKSSALEDSVQKEFTSAGIHKAKLTVRIGNTSGTKDISCDALIEIDEKPAISKEKIVSNNTQNKPDANNTTAKPGDQLTFKITAQNSTTGTEPAYVFEDFIGDVLDYADIVSISDNIKPDSHGNLVWPAVKIGGKESVSKTIVVKVKDPIPTTNTPHGDKTRYDLKMTNVFGNQVTVNVPEPLVKKTEAATTNLPNTGPNSSLVVCFFITFIAAYFYARSRLIDHELAITRAEYTASGGF